MYVLDFDFSIEDENMYLDYVISWGSRGVNSGSRPCVLVVVVIIVNGVVWEGVYIKVICDDNSTFPKGRKI